MVRNPCAKPVLLVVYGRQATNTWIYYTNKSPLSTIIWLNFATKLCQRRTASDGPSRGQKDTLSSAHSLKAEDGGSPRPCHSDRPVRKDRGGQTYRTVRRHARRPDI